MDYCNGIWLKMNDVSDDFNERFSRGMYALGIPGKQVWFDRLDCKKDIARQNQEGMTIDDFFAIDRQPFPGVSFAIGRTENYGNGWEPSISFAWRIVAEAHRVDYFYWFKARYYDAIEPVGNLFKSVYNQCIFSFPRLG